ncbi:hypothetical protein NFI96_007779 [Prochilodus magdalenae]|nr:hypothetical protein NFI96_007779 [Prochilodus magdalenae]
MAATALAGAAVGGGDGPVMEAKKFEYFSSINSMARKIMQEREKIKEQFGPTWDEMTPAEQDSAIDDGMVDPKIRARYAMHRVERDEVVCYPKLLIQTGQKVVHFGEESQLEFSVISGAPEAVISSSVPESKPKTSQSGRREEESSFWKISAERSRLEGEKADFQSLTPSQIKSLEKGEKPLPSYLRMESGGEEPQAPRPVKQRAAKPPAPPPPPPAPISVTPAVLNMTPAVLNVPPAVLNMTPAALNIAPTASVPAGGWERAQSTLPSASSPVDDVFSPGLATKTPSQTIPAKESEKVDLSPAASPTFSQVDKRARIQGSRTWSPGLLTTSLAAQEHHSSLTSGKTEHCLPTLKHDGGSITVWDRYKITTQLARNSGLYRGVVQDTVTARIHELNLNRKWVLQKDYKPENTSEPAAEWLNQRNGRVQMLRQNLRWDVHARKPTIVTMLEQYFEEDTAGLSNSYRKRLVEVIASPGAEPQSVEVGGGTGVSCCWWRFTRDGRREGEGKEGERREKERDPSEEGRERREERQNATQRKRVKTCLAVRCFEGKMVSAVLLVVVLGLTFVSCTGAEGNGTVPAVSDIQFFISGHRTQPTGRCPQDAAHRTLPTGRCPQDAAHRTLLSGQFWLVDDSQSSCDTERSSSTAVSDPLTPPPRQCHCSAENDPPPTYYLLCGGPVGVRTIEEQGNTVYRETDGLQSGPVHLQSVLYGQWS